MKGTGILSTWWDRVGVLRLRLPLLVLLWAALSGLAVFVVMERQRESAFVDRFLMEKAVAASQLQQVVEGWAHRNDEEMVQSIIAGQAVGYDVKSAVLLDANSEVVAATQRAWLGQPFDFGTLGFRDEELIQFQKLLREVRRTRQRDKMFTDDRDRLFLCLPAVLPTKTGGLTIKAAGLLVVEYDLRVARTILLQNRPWQFFGYLTGLLLVSIGLGVRLHFLVARRLKRLETAMAEFAQGKPFVPAKVSGHDEISHLVAQFNELATTVRREMAERERAMAALRESEQRMRLHREQTPLGVIEWDLQFRVVAWNPSAERIFGYGREEAMGHSATELVLTEAVRPQVAQVWQSLLTQRGGFRSSNENVTKDGRVIICEWYNTPLVDASGAVIGVASLVHDVTRERRAEQEVAKLNAELEQRVVERTAQLEAANQELEAFSYSISHDLRAPLRAIDGFARILLENYHGRLDEEGQRLLNIVCSQAKRMGLLIDDLLHFSRAGRQEMLHAPVDMTSMARIVFDELAVHAKGRKLQFRLGELPPAQGDPAMVRQVWANLLSNAIKYTSGKAIAEIEVTGTREGEQNVYCVKDNGIGFEMQYAEKLFGVFQRLHSDEQFEGTGVGLALVQRIIHRHQGRIWAESKHNEGATFRFTLPVYKEPS